MRPPRQRLRLALLAPLALAAPAWAQSGVYGEVFGALPEDISISHVLSMDDTGVINGRALVDSLGAYRLPLSPGAYTLHVSAKDGRGTFVRNVIVEPHTMTPLDLTIDDDDEHQVYAPPYVEGWTRPSLYVPGDGETIREVARRFGVSSAAIAEANSLPPDADAPTARTLVIPSRPLTTEEVLRQTTAMIDAAIAGSSAPPPIRTYRPDAPAPPDLAPEASGDPPARGPDVAVGADPAGAPLAAEIGASRALLFATDRYDDPALADLANPIRDAEAVAAELAQHYGFAVEVVRNPTRAEVFRALDAAAGTLDSTAQLLVFVAGHGTLVGDRETGRGYIIPRDGRADDRSTWVSYANLADELDALPVRRLLLLLDVCYGGAFVERSRAASGVRGTTPEALVRRYGRYRSRLALTSGALEYVSDGVAGRHSPFAAGLLRALRSPGGLDADGLLTFTELVGFARGVPGPTPLAGGFGRHEVAGEFFLAVGAADAPRRSEEHADDTAGAD